MQSSRSTPSKRAETRLSNITRKLNDFKKHFVNVNIIDYITTLITLMICDTSALDYVEFMFKLLTNYHHDM